VFKLLNKNDVWKGATKKNLYSDSLAQVNSKPSDSMFWKGLMKVKDDFFSRGSFEVENGLDTRIWEDT
jgi:hypothetical protein